MFFEVHSHLLICALKFAHRVSNLDRWNLILWLMCLIHLVWEAGIVGNMLISKLLITDVGSSYETFVNAALFTQVIKRCVGAAAVYKLRHWHVEFDGMRMLKKCLIFLLHLHVTGWDEWLNFAHIIRLVHIRLI